MAGYTKLFNSILASSVWQESLSTKVLWITMLAMADKDGIAEASIPGLAKISGLSIAETEAGIASLAAPDKYSRTKEFEGRRIEACEGGWKILNHPKYRAKMSADERREYKRIKQREYRAEKSTLSTRGQSGHNAEAKAEAEAKDGQERPGETVEQAATSLFREKNPLAEGKVLDEIECPICYRSGHLKLTQARGAHPAGFWCDKRGGCGANWPLKTEAILSLMTPRGRKAIEAMMPPEDKPYESPGMVLTSELKFDEKGMLIE